MRRIGRLMQPAGAFDSPTTGRPVKKKPSASARPPTSAVAFSFLGYALRGGVGRVCLHRTAGQSARVDGAEPAGGTFPSRKSNQVDGGEARPSVGEHHRSEM